MVVLTSCLGTWGLWEQQILPPRLPKVKLVGVMQGKWRSPEEGTLIHPGLTSSLYSPLRTSFQRSPMFFLFLTGKAHYLGKIASVIDCLLEAGHSVDIVRVSQHSVLGLYFPDEKTEAQRGVHLVSGHTARNWLKWHWNPGILDFRVVSPGTHTPDSHASCPQVGEGR